MSLRLEDDMDSCGKNQPCPKIWSDLNDPDGVFIQGKDATARIREEALIPDDEVVTRYPRGRLLDWAARQLSGQAR
jgi:hypothetical protein